MKPIVTDTYDFSTLIEKGYVYVDKTAFLRRMISGVDGRLFFMSRPRRFGKSLMISTLEQIFKGNRKLFKGLAIDKSDYDWKSHPVIRLDMSQIRAPDIAGCRRVLCALLADLGALYSLDLSDEDKYGKSAKAALKQCHSRDYAAPYAADKRRIFCVGVNYDTLKRNVDTLNDTLNAALNDTLNSRVLSLIRQRPGLRRPDLMAALNVSESTVTRCLRGMRASIAFRGPAKTGGYYILESKGGAR